MGSSEAVSKLDLSDVDARVGQLVGGGQQYSACSATDIRRWVMALDYPNPIHWDEEFAQSVYGGLVAPQSIAVCLDVGHGVQPACVGRIPGSHVIFGGEEWWFYGYRIRPGDRLMQERRFHDYKVAETKFAGPTVFQRGDTTHRNQNGTLVARERTTAIRYLVSEADKRKMYKNQLGGGPKRWTADELQQIAKVRHAWILSNRMGVSPRFSSVKVGDKLPRRVHGPHNIASFATEYRAFIGSIWGTYGWVAPAGVADPWIHQDAGWVSGFGLDHEAAKIDPRFRDGLVSGPSRGHVDDSNASKIGMARAYGYGATMGAWNTDYLAYWAGNDGFVRYSKSIFRSPAFEGDVTFFDGEVVAKEADSEWGVPLVTIDVKLTSQDGSTVVSSTNKVELPY